MTEMGRLTSRTNQMTEEMGWSSAAGNIYVMPWQLDFPSQLEQYGVLLRLPSKRNFAANRTSLSISIVGGEAKMTKMISLFRLSVRTPFFPSFMSIQRRRAACSKLSDLQCAHARAGLNAPFPLVKVTRRGDDDDDGDDAN